MFTKYILFTVNKWSPKLPWNVENSFCYDESDGHEEIREHNQRQQSKRNTKT